MEKLKELLRNNDVPFEIIHHEQPIRSAQEGADYFGIEIGQTAPTLVLKSDKGYYALIMSGARGRANLEDLSAMLGCGQLKLASPKEVRQTTGYTVGSVPLIGLPMPYIVDKRLDRYPYIYGGTGAATATLKISPAALEKLNKVVAFLNE